MAAVGKNLSRSRHGMGRRAMVWGTLSSEANAEALNRAERAAAQRGLGERTHTVHVGSRLTGLGCVSAFPALGCLIAGLGLLGTTHGAGLTALAGVLLALVVAIPAAALWTEGRLTHRDLRLYVFDRGLVVTRGRTETLAMTWPEVRVAERTETSSYGQHSHGATVHWLYLQRPDGLPLTRINTNNPAGVAISRAVAKCRERKAAVDEG
ncbi:hypothetical protein ACFQ1B_00360 [Streptomyces mexicanus]